ncbi:hypothetical protein [Pedobacter steynii]|uniref:Outer membrane protein beta-barrel domain-containing protein n=1 Tax=Pedobacter steynii TaxID=430522 RepID=A0A1D7QKT5_9SPHI|nr:hypothetical protein [Pedobacter steynii]AOM79294.1 hypothetical protein BFS30_20265 [Pedobacter steynii]
MELDDNEFDAAFRKRVFDADPQFEEAAWDKMEHKLRRRERVVLFRKGSVVLSLLLLVGLIGYYSFDKSGPKKNKPELVKEIKGVQEKKESIPGNEELRSGNKEVLPEDDGLKIGNESLLSENRSGTQHQLNGTRLIEEEIAANGAEQVNRAGQTKYLAELKKTDLNATHVFGESKLAGLSLTPYDHTGPSGLSKQTEPVVNKAAEADKKKIRTNLKRPVPMSLALSAGPEFNSASSLIGGKGGFNAGLTFSMGIAKNFRLQTGLKYSVKDYATDSYAYRMRNSKIPGLISGIDASCAVLEIPLIASYTVAENQQRSIDLNLGLSSYLMLKEDYTFKYTPGSGIADRLVEKRNANQHLMSVVDLSATYFIKLKTEKFKIGVEPFVKIPLTGVGEGKVNLKSSGISLKIRYDLDK